MRKLVILACLVMASLWCVAPIVADENEDMQGEQAMPPMGPPDELKQTAYLIGDWDVSGKWQFQEDTTWTGYKASASFEHILDGAAVRMNYTGDFMGQPFHGVGITTYDREYKRWEQVWIDNMSARMSYYTGNEKDGKFVYTGTDKYGGMEYQGKIVTEKVSDTKFKWEMQMSMDGKEWHTTMTATYTKK